jgi:hypothetical protein
MALKVPSHFIPMLNSIRKLSESSAKELLKALESTSIESSSEEMCEHIAAKVPSIPKEELAEITDVLYAMYHVREFSDLSRNGFLKELVDSVREHADPSIADEELPLIRQRFKDLLSIGTLETISKAVGLQRENQRIYCEAKIISDIRPIFGDDVKQKPVAATLEHSLQLHYHEDGDHKQFYVVLDEVDLENLEQAVQRAKTKADTLTKVLSDSGIPRLGI